jgi:peptide/nickel transport system permease protein
MTRYVVVRLVSALPVLALVTLLTFIAIRVLPGDLAQMRLGDNATPENVRALREELGLDEPVLEQYGAWASDLLRGDPGVSLQSGLPVAQQFRSRLPVTLELALVSTLVSIVLAVPLGVVSAVRRGGLLDHIVRVLAVLGQAVPSFWLAIVALTFLSIYAHWAPPFAYRTPWTDPVHNMKQLLLPSLILGYAQSALLMRIVRSTMLEILEQDYIRTARAKGLRDRTVVFKHALANALIPIITVIGVQTGTLIGGTIVLEQIFSLPGIGKLTLVAITSRDYTQLQFNVVFIAVMVVLMNLIVDLGYLYADPRLRR